MDKIFEFSLFVSGLDPNDNTIEDRMYDANCDDATVVYQRGWLTLDFIRRSSDVRKALLSAIEDALKAGVIVHHIEPSNLVTSSEISRRASVTRAAISNYITGVRAADFPPPVDCVASERPLWSWVEVASWLHEHDSSRVDSAELEKAVAIADLNAALRQDVFLEEFEDQDDDPGVRTA